jgi:hypothetical protein
VNKVQIVFDKWVAFMNLYGPMGKGEGSLNTDEFRALRVKIKAELAQLDADDDNFNCGAMS